MPRSKVGARTRPLFVMDRRRRSGGLSLGLPNRRPPLPDDRRVLTNDRIVLTPVAEPRKCHKRRPAGLRTSAKFRNTRKVPLSCPTCQVAWSNAGRCRLLCMGLFSIF
ncbi:hypothetical protein chiPu_0033093 [Chiloscyllium punctatum]|uniref:Uncharacterized protein n=1 Tax=Chiloscyllium punctatum TaxID=137246 RepID=A0A401U1W4_CHIPU|nr:hypothetical protein [Chiloscyllium punctatum]